MRYVIDKKNGTEAIYAMSAECERCLSDYGSVDPGDFPKGAASYRKISSGKIGSSFLQFISIDFDKVKKDVTELFHLLKDCDINAALDEVDKYLDQYPFYMKLVGIEECFVEHMSEDAYPDMSFEDALDIAFDEVVMIRKIVEAYSDNKSFVEPVTLLRAINEYRLMFCPSVYTPDMRDDWRSFKEDPVGMIQSFEKQCNAKRGSEYEIEQFYMMFGIPFDWIVTHGYKINRCKICGRFFIAYTKRDAMYCTYEYKNGKSCRTLAFEINMGNDAVMALYRKIYKTKHARMLRSRDRVPRAEADFEKWHRAAKKMVDKCRAGKLSEKECIDWLENNK